MRSSPDGDSRPSCLASSSALATAGSSGLTAARRNRGRQQKHASAPGVSCLARFLRAAMRDGPTPMITFREAATKRDGTRTRARTRREARRRGRAAQSALSPARPALSHLSGTVRGWSAPFRAATPLPFPCSRLSGSVPGGAERKHRGAEKAAAGGERGGMRKSARRCSGCELDYELDGTRRAETWIDGPGGQVERLGHFAARDRLRLEALQRSARLAGARRPAGRRRPLEQLHALGEAQLRRVVLVPLV